MRESAVEKVLRQRLPTPAFSALRWVYNQRPSAARERRAYRRQVRIGERVAEITGNRVARGPFAGMHYVNAYGDRAAKLLGSYERELHPIIESLSGYDTIVNVGAAEGYYAVGLAVRTGAQVVAFEMDATGRALCAELAARNEVTVETRGECAAGDIGAVSRGRTLVVIDVEGAEMFLLDPAVDPALCRADLLVELHDFVNPAIKPTILGRFPDHDVTLVRTEARDPTDYPELAALSAEDARLAVNEHRPCPMEWAWLRAS